ncbi:hypothetical protein [Micromonospora sp. RTP1Z1]|uniref:hypothetical protein n=1 Tax=Micromonospora sp. RTP1Z1 TaxID=2994043 RepID=UPI0029C74C7A|nr:hypothetical protein [Micromonospora sp. RTP1Z1]
MTETAWSRRNVLKRGALLLGAATAGPAVLTACGGGGGPATATGAGGRDPGAPLSMQLGWLLDNGQLGEAVAIGKGWFADNGINVSIAPGGPSTPAGDLDLG